MPQDGQQHYHQHSPQSSSQSQLSYETASRSGTPCSPLPAGSVPYVPGHASSNPQSGPESGLERDRRGYAPSSTPHPSSSRNPYADPGRSRNGHVRTATQSVSTPMGRTASGGVAHEAAPLPPGFNYSAPLAHPHTSHRQYRNRDMDRERMRDIRDWIGTATAFGIETGTETGGEILGEATNPIDTGKKTRIRASTRN